MPQNQDHTEAGNYVKSIRAALKRRYASTYLEWMRSGRIGAAPSRGKLSAGIAKAVGLNLDSLG